MAEELEIKRQELTKLSEVKVENVSPKAVVASTFQMAKLQSEILLLQDDHCAQVGELFGNVDPEVVRAAEALQPGQSTDVDLSHDPDLICRNKFGAAIAKHRAAILPLIIGRW